MVFYFQFPLLADLDENIEEIGNFEMINLDNFSAEMDFYVMTRIRNRRKNRIHLKNTTPIQRIGKGWGENQQREKFNIKFKRVNDRRHLS